MSNAIFKMPCPQNEPVLNYGPGSPEKAKLKAALEELKGKELDIPLIINGQEVRTGVTGDCVMPHNHGHRLAKFHQAGAAEVEAAIEAALKARKAWANMPWEQRAGIFMKAAEILAHEKRYLLNAATMLGVSKTPIQAEIDSACELIDFWRFNVHYMEEIYRQQPRSTPLSWNRVEHRGLEGFIFAVTPFNFTAIAGNLPTAPAMMGNTVVWKPASSAVYPAYFVMKVLEEIENGKLYDLEFFEGLACIGGCVGGPLVFENNFVAQNRLQKLISKMKPYKPISPEEVEQAMSQCEWQWNKEVLPKSVMKLDDDIFSAIKKMEELQRIYADLPGLDCGSCGAPSCRTLAEDIVRGNAVEFDCIIKFREKVRTLAQEMIELSDYTPTGKERSSKEKEENHEDR